MLTTAKTDEKYDTMTDEAKTKWKEAWDKERAAVAAFIAKDKTSSGYSVMTTE